MLYQTLLGAGWYLIVGASLGWIVLILSVCRQTGHLQAVTALGPLARSLDWLTEGAAPISAPSPGARQPSGNRMTAANIRAVLDEWLVGQTALNDDVARAIEIFVSKRNPARPLSIIIGGPAGSGRTRFAEGLAAATALDGKPSLARIDCASDVDIDLAKTAAALRGVALPVLLLDNIDRFGSHRHSGAFMAELSRVLENGVIRGQPLLRRAILVQTVLVDSAVAKDANQQASRAPNDAQLIMRQSLLGTGRLPDDLVTRVELVSLMKPLEPMEQIEVVWKTFRAMAETEHEIVIVEDDGVGKGDGIMDFLITARERWVKAGISGVRDAARYVASSADEALVEASRSGWTVVRARWDRQRQRFWFEPAAAPGYRAASARAV